jgi:apolipoprotein N-acyltransferase
LRTFDLASRAPALLALLLGALSAFAFEPVGWWWLMPIALVGLCELVSRRPTVWGALRIGWAFGLGQFAVGLNWIATAFTFQAAMPAWLGWVAVVLLSLYLAVYPAIAAGLAWRLGKGRPVALVLALAGAWPVVEWLRGTIFTGFPWNPAGVTLVDTPWRFIASFIGTYGLGMLVVLGGGAIWLAVRRQWRPALAIAIPLGLILALPAPVMGPECCLKTFDAAEATGSPTLPGRYWASPPPPADPSHAPPSPPASPPPPPPAPESPPPPPPVTPHSAFVSGAVRVVQPNIGQGDKWRPGFEDVAAQRLAELSRRPYARGQIPADTIFWPETAVTQPLVDERLAASAAAEFERKRAASSIAPGQLLATGGLAILSDDGVRISGATNSMFVLDSAGTIVGRYDKAHLVPYGEYLPMRPLLSAIGISRLAPGDFDLNRGPGPRTLLLPNGRKMGVQICYEIIFSGHVVDPADRPDFIFNPSNDAWYGAWGPPQHLAQARLRAAEEGLPVIRSTPTGVSAVVDASGALVGTIPLGEAGVIDAGLPGKTAPTLFSRFGNIIPLALGFLLIALAIALGTRRRYRRT